MSELASKVLADGEYYVFTKQEEGKVGIGYIYTTWCGTPCGTRIDFAPVELGKPLQLTQTGDSRFDKGQLKAFAFDRRNTALINDVYNRARQWLKNMQPQHQYPQLDKTEGCTIAAITVSGGILTSLSENTDI